MHVNNINTQQPCQICTGLEKVIFRCGSTDVKNNYICGKSTSKLVILEKICMRINPILNSKVEATGTSLIESWLYWIVSNYFIKIDIECFFPNSFFSLSGLWIENTASYKTIGHTSQSPSRRMYTVNFEIATKKSTRMNKKLCVYLHIPKTLNKNHHQTNTNYSNA